MHVRTMSTPALSATTSRASSCAAFSLMTLLRDARARPEWELKIVRNAEEHDESWNHASMHSRVGQVAHSAQWHRAELDKSD